MPRYAGQADIGDVVITREGPWAISLAIRLGAWLRRRPAVVNHVIVVHHRDAAGVLWGVEGRPGGVGWRDLSGPLSWKHTHANTEQPKTEEQRAAVARVMEAMLEQPYDWAGIAEDAAQALLLAWAIPAAEEWRDGEVPGAVVCSSLADYAYELVGLANPGGGAVTRTTTPGDWDAFITRRVWR